MNMAPQQQLQRLPRPTSMLFDLEMEEAPGHQHELDAEGLQAVQAVSSLVSRAMTAASQAVRDVESACQSLLSQGARVCAAGLGQLLSSNMGYAVSLRESLGGGAGGQCLRNLRHCCLVLQRPQTATSNNIGSTSIANSSSSSIDSIIVDPTFRDQFAIAHPSARYAAVLDSLPAVFVGPAGRIPQLVELLCAEMSLAFQAAGIVLPPWRHTKSMLSKWQPRRSVELPASATAKAAAAVSVSAAQPHENRQLQAAEASGPSSSDSGLLQGAAGGGNGSSSGFSAATHAGSADSNDSSASGSDERQQLPSVQRQGSGMSCAAPPLASSAVPVQRQKSFEPLQRVVGGFAVSLVAQQSPLVQ